MRCKNCGGDVFPGSGSWPVGEKKCHNCGADMNGVHICPTSPLLKGHETAGGVLTNEELDAEIECLFSESDSSSVHMEKVHHAQAIEVSHEALRAEMSRLEAERAAFRLHHVEACHDLHARAEKAEHERDEARRMYCVATADRGYGSVREVCEQAWPDAAAALFPVVVKP